MWRVQRTAASDHRRVLRRAILGHMSGVLIAAITAVASIVAALVAKPRAPREVARVSARVSLREKVPSRAARAALALEMKRDTLNGIRLRREVWRRYDRAARIFNVLTSVTFVASLATIVIQTFWSIDPAIVQTRVIPLLAFLAGMTGAFFQQTFKQLRIARKDPLNVALRDRMDDIDGQIAALPWSEADDEPVLAAIPSSGQPPTPTTGALARRGGWRPWRPGRRG